MIDIDFEKWIVLKNTIAIDIQVFCYLYQTAEWFSNGRMSSSVNEHASSPDVISAPASGNISLIARITQAGMAHFVCLSRTSPLCSQHRNCLVAIRRHLLEENGETQLAVGHQLESAYSTKCTAQYSVYHKWCTAKCYVQLNFAQCVRHITLCITIQVLPSALCNLRCIRCVKYCTVQRYVQLGCALCVRQIHRVEPCSLCNLKLYTVCRILYSSVLKCSQNAQSGHDILHCVT